MAAKKDDNSKENSESKKSGNKKLSKADNPQLVVIQSVLDDLAKIDKFIATIVVSPNYETETDDAIAHLRERNQALINILVRDNYYRNLCNQYLADFFELPNLAEEALTDEDVEQAVAIAKIWEQIAYNILKECYPDFSKRFEKLLNAVSRMTIMPVPTTGGAKMAGLDMSMGTSFIPR